MDQIFAPWRIDWVERDDRQAETEGCPFCVLPDRDDDRANGILARSEHSYVLQNNYPYNPGHVMVIPDRHVDGWGDLSDAELLDHSRLKVRTLEAIRAAQDPDGFNAGENLGGAPAGGSIDDHVHTHVIPRWSGDTSFMPIVAETKVIVEGLEATYDRLREGFAGLEGATVPDDDAAAVRIEDTTPPGVD